MPKGKGYGGGSMRGMKSGGGMMKMDSSGGKSMMMDSRGNGGGTNRNIKTTPGPIMPMRGKK